MFTQKKILLSMNICRIMVNNLIKEALVSEDSLCDQFLCLFKNERLPERESLSVTLNFGAK